MQNKSIALEIIEWDRRVGYTGGSKGEVSGVLVILTILMWVVGTGYIYCAKIHQAIH